MSAAARAAGVASPCINICRMDERSGWCEGCLRTLDEIASWGGLDDVGRRAVLQQLRPRRLARRALLAVQRGTAPAPAPAPAPERE